MFCSLTIPSLNHFLQHLLFPCDGSLRLKRKLVQNTTNEHTQEQSNRFRFTHFWCFLLWANIFIYSRRVCTVYVWVDGRSHSALTNVKEIFNNLDIWMLFSNLVYCYRCLPSYHSSNLQTRATRSVRPPPSSPCVVGVFVFLSHFQFRMPSHLLRPSPTLGGIFCFYSPGGKMFDTRLSALCVRKSFYSWNFLFPFCRFHTLDNLSSLARAHRSHWDFETRWSDTKMRTSPV